MCEFAFDFDLPTCVIFNRPCLAFCSMQTFLNLTFIKNKKHIGRRILHSFAVRARILLGNVCLVRVLRVVLQYTQYVVHCIDTIPEIRNKYSQIRNCTTSDPSSTHIHVSVSDLYIPTISLPILLKENRWTDPGNI
jgi:hypothetical protein